MNKKIIEPVALIKTGFKEKFGIPRQSGRAPSTMGEITLLGKYNNPDAVREIENFSHLWLIFGFSLNPETQTLSVRPPRLGGNKKVGVFATRSPFRPNGLGLSSVKLERVDVCNGVKLIVSGVDLVDGTPIYDIKPYIPHSDKIEDAVGGFSDEFIDYKLKVIMPNSLTSTPSKEILTQIVECLEDDPRPSYHNDDREYGFTYQDYNVKFKVDGKTLNIIDIINT
ncbi:MAG: tRNA (N6-threonylcarbamoyladenosine(37)-N6)-methyltransferase TrmO [Clostridia bacterium]|nr:tRNA (N6-threonylcarbamoyladenosine(37)-N6)-methyltransferase TrmO [Clostridia bacterium]